MPGHMTQATLSLDQSKYLIIMLKSERLVCDYKMPKTFKTKILLRLIVLCCSGTKLKLRYNLLKRFFLNQAC